MKKWIKAIIRFVLGVWVVFAFVPNVTFGAVVIDPQYPNNEHLYVTDSNTHYPFVLGFYNDDVVFNSFQSATLYTATNCTGESVFPDITLPAEAGIIGMFSFTSNNLNTYSSFSSSWSDGMTTNTYCTLLPTPITVQSTAISSADQTQRNIYNAYAVFFSAMFFTVWLLRTRR